MPSKCKECPTRASYGKPESKLAEYCATHKKEGMVNVVSKTCKECPKQPYYGKPGSKLAEYCATHKKEGMVDIVNKTCKECPTRPVYGKPASKLAEYCATHKKEGMVDVVNKTCKECPTRPVYGKPGSKLAEYCTAHKKDGMVNVVSKTCKECPTQPYYGKPGSKLAEYCATHKKEGMIDVKNKTCKKENCPTQACYGIKGKQPEYCSTHKKEGMVDVKNKSCKEENCPTNACYGIKGSKIVEYCATHKKEGMVDIKNKTCKNEWCDTLVTKKYDGYCYFCFVHMFPDHELTRSYKTKEKAVTDFVKNEFPDIDFICDKQIYDGCSKKRPDMFADFGDWVLIIEVDENEHTGYTCNNKRLMQLSQDIDHRPLTMIRFNPDKYTKDDVKVASCWRNGKKGTVLVKTKADEWTERLERLKRRIQKSIDNPSDQTIKLYNLFFSK